MLEAAQLARQCVQGLSKGEFLTDRRTQRRFDCLHVRGFGALDPGSIGSFHNLDTVTTFLCDQ